MGETHGRDAIKRHPALKRPNRLDNPSGVAEPSGITDRGIAPTATHGAPLRGENMDQPAALPPTTPQDAEFDEAKRQC